MKSQDAPSGTLEGNDPSKGRAPHGARMLAEWVSFGVSALIVAALAGYLVYDGLRPRAPIVPIEVLIAIDRAAPSDGRYIVPVEVHNRGTRTLNDVKIEVTQAGPDGSMQSQDFDIDYLPQASHETLYLYIDSPPRDAKIEARAVQYQLE